MGLKGRYLFGLSFCTRKGVIGLLQIGHACADRAKIKDFCLTRLDSYRLRWSVLALFDQKVDKNANCTLVHNFIL